MGASGASSIVSAIRKVIVDRLPRESSASDFWEEPERLFASPMAQTIKNEIIQAGKKLWERQYVDGNGGNISARISPQYVICTPTLRSKGDLRVEDLSLVDLDNCQICGSCAPTSEILLHLEIYKTVPEARAVIHCHPPYATAHAVAGVIPQGNLVPEQEVFVGPVVLTPYETPGTMEFARTVIPVVKQHNTILLQNHGIVCWADTVTHAEWYAEIIENYCKTVMIASQLKSPLKEIPADKIAELLAIKQKLGLPDARLPQDHGALAVDSDAEPPLSTEQSSSTGPFLGAQSDSTYFAREEELEQLVASITSQILEFVEKNA